MWSSIINLVGGSLLGVVGGWVTKWMDLKAEEKKFEHEVALKRVDAEIMQQEWAARTKVAEVEAAGRVEAADSAAFGEAVKAEAGRYSTGVKPSVGQGWMLVLLDVMRGTVRPGLTIYLCAITSVLAYKAYALMPYQPDSTWAADLVREITMKILFLTDVATCFWFGTRVKSK